MEELQKKIITKGYEIEQKSVFIYHLILAYNLCPTYVTQENIAQLKNKLTGLFTKIGKHIHIHPQVCHNPAECPWKELLNKLKDIIEHDFDIFFQKIVNIIDECLFEIINPTKKPDIENATLKEKINFLMRKYILDFISKSISDILLIIIQGKDILINKAETEENISKTQIKILLSLAKKAIPLNSEKLEKENIKLFIKSVFQDIKDKILVEKFFKEWKIQEKLKKICNNNPDCTMNNFIGAGIAILDDCIINNYNKILLGDSIPFKTAWGAVKTAIFTFRKTTNIPCPNIDMAIGASVQEQEGGSLQKYENIINPIKNKINDKSRFKNYFSNYGSD